MKRPSAERGALTAVAKRHAVSPQLLAALATFDTLTNAPAVGQPAALAWRTVRLLHAHDLELDAAVRVLGSVATPAQVAALVFDDDEPRASLVAVLQLVGVFRVEAFAEAPPAAVKRMARALLRAPRSMHDDLWTVWLEGLCSHATPPPPALAEALVRALLRCGRWSLAQRALSCQHVQLLNLCPRLLDHLVTEHDDAQLEQAATSNADIDRHVVRAFAMHGVDVARALLDRVLRAPRTAVRRSALYQFFVAAVDGIVARDALLRQWLSIAVAEANADLLANTIVLANRTTNGGGGSCLSRVACVFFFVSYFHLSLAAWLTKVLGSSVLKGPQTEALCVALTHCVDTEADTPFCAQVAVAVGNLVRMALLQGSPAALEQLQQKLRLNSLAISARTASEQVAEAVKQFAADGFVLPPALVTHAARNPTQWRVEFLPALLCPQPRSQDYFHGPLEGQSAQDRLVRPSLKCAGTVVG